MSTWLRISLGLIAGAILGYAYYYFWGCNEGCPLRSTWYVTTLYGAAMGLVVAFPTKRKGRQNDEREKEDNERNDDRRDD